MKPIGKIHPHSELMLAMAKVERNATPAVDLSDGSPRCPHCGAVVSVPPPPTTLLRCRACWSLCRTEGRG